MKKPVPINESEQGYKYLCIGMALILCFIVPVMLYSPVIFGGVSMQIMPTYTLVISLASIIVGIWYLVSAMYLTNNQKQFAAIFLHGNELAILAVPYVIYVGTKSMLGFGGK